jgi:hypothetical protein
LRVGKGNKEGYPTPSGRAMRQISDWDIRKR